MKRLLSVVLAYTLTISSLASAQDVVRSRVQALQEVPEVPALPPGEDRIEALQEGQRAPFTGMLLDTDTAIRWTNALRWWPETFRLRVELLGGIQDEAEASHARQLRLVEESYGREIEGLREDMRGVSQRLADALQRPWYDTPMFGAVVGALVVLLLGAVAGGIAAAVAP